MISGTKLQENILKIATNESRRNSKVKSILEIAGENLSEGTFSWHGISHRSNMDVHALCLLYSEKVRFNHSNTYKLVHIPIFNLKTLL